MSVNAAVEEARSLRGLEAELGVAAAVRSGLPDPFGAAPRTVRLHGRRLRQDEDAGALPWPPPGWLASLHGHPRLGALTSFLDVRSGEVAWRVAASGGLALEEVLAGALGGDRVAIEARPRFVAPHQGALLGHPLPAGIADAPEPPGVDLLLDALPDGTVSLAVLARPVLAAEVDQVLADLARHLEVLSRLDEVGRRHPEVVATQRVLDAHERYLQARRAAGLWHVTAVLGAPDRETLDVACTSAGGAFGDHPDAVRGLRALPCTADGRLPPFAGLWGPAELARLLRPPRRDRPGFEITSEMPFDLHPPPAGRRAWHLGRALVGGAPRGPAVNLDLDRLTRHALVAGMTGSGKTHTVTRLLVEASAHGIPWLVVEPTKREYRRLLRATSPSARPAVYTAGVETPGLGHPLRIDPFLPPRGTPLGTWIDGLIALFEAAFVLYPPMPYVLQTAVHHVYEQAGWSVVGDRRGRAPTLDDLVRTCDEVIDGLGYDRRLSADVRASLRARLGTLLEGSRATTYASSAAVPDAELFERPTVVELDALPRAEDKAFAMGLLVLRLSCWRRFGPDQGARDDLRHLLVIEEAHRLLRADAGAGEEGASSRRRGVEQLTDLISEIRAFGQGVIIADQVPSRLAEDAVKNTDLKLLHRLVSDDDRTIAGGAAAMNEAQKEHLVRLRRGELALYAEPMDRPMLVAVALLDPYPTPPDDAEVAVAMRHTPPPKPYPGCSGCTLRDVPCGPTWAEAHALAATPALARSARRAAILAARGDAQPPLDLPADGALARCARGQLARTAAAAVTDALGADGAAHAALASAVAEGGRVMLPAPRAEGPLSTCGSCPAPCRWLPLGRRLAGDAEPWALRPPESLDEVGPRLQPALRAVTGWAGLLRGHEVADAVFCVAAHELDAALPPATAAEAARAVRAHIGTWR